MEGATVSGRENQMKAYLAEVEEACRPAAGGVGTLQGLDRRRGGTPLTAIALVQDQTGFGQGDEVAAAIPAQQGIAVGAVGANPVALRRLRVGEGGARAGGRHVAGARVATAIAGQHPVEVGGRGGEATVGERGGVTAADLRPTGVAVRRSAESCSWRPRLSQSS